mgnify:CR=1 FL=1
MAPRQPAPKKRADVEARTKATAEAVARAQRAAAEATAARERVNAQQQADTLVENRDAAQKLQELREAHGADSEEYRAERERIVSVAASKKADNERLAE